jgi:hypothetical protein
MAMRSVFKGISGLILIAVIAGLWTNAAELVHAKPETADKGINTRVPIQDPVILEGWNYLHTLEDPIALWDGKTLTGKALAEFIKDSQIPVVWGNAAICEGGSCSRLYCHPDGACNYEDGNPGIDPIYLNAGIRNQTNQQVVRAAAELAHEAFHRMRPFGQGKATQLEEYWAFYIGAQISKDAWPDFQGYDPMDKNQLEQWFTYHTMTGYLKLDAYPAGFQHLAGKSTVETSTIVNQAQGVHR